MLKIAIVDDDEKALEATHELICNYFNDKNVETDIITINSKTDAFNIGQKFDIAFLDVEMPNKNGIEIGYELQKNNNEILIFIVTSYLKYLDEAMDLKVFRYLQKPIDKQRLFKALDIVLQKENSFKVTTKGGTVFLNESQIVLIYSCLRKTHVLLDNGNEIEVSTNIKQWRQILNDNSNFSSPHNSYLVNLKYVSDMVQNKITVKCKNGYDMVVYASQRKLVQFKKTYFNKMREQK